MASRDAIIVASHLPDESPIQSETYPVLDVVCRGEFSYWAGLQSVWSTDKTIVNVEHDMQYSDDMVTDLLECPHPMCAYIYQVFPTQLGRFIYCATQNRQAGIEAWIKPTDGNWADYSSIGFIKIAPEARVRPLAKLFWQWLEQSVDRSLDKRFRWCLHGEIEHHHDYEHIPDHLW